MLKKSKFDNKNYKYIKLKNDMDVLIIQDININESAIALSVNVGSMNDVKCDINGIAHFTEHLLFMGSKKYPKEDLFFNKINKYHGISNAYTSHDHTCYYYKVVSQYFFELLDIFGNFFIEPIFNNDSVNREINAVSSEHNKNVNDDNRRYFRLLQLICNNEHPFYNFSTGNIDTLNINDIRKKTIEFYKNQYSSKIMKIVIISNIDIEDIEFNVISIFENVNDNKYNKLNIYNPLIISQNKIIVTKPINENINFFLFWNIEYNDSLIYLHVLDLIKYIITGDNNNNLIDIFKKKNIISDFDFDYTVFINNSILIQIEITLMNDDIKCIKYIIFEIINYFNILLKSSNEYILKIYEQFVKISENNYTYDGILSLEYFVQEISSFWSTNNYNIFSILMYNIIIDNNKQNTIVLLKKILSQFINDNLHVIIGSKFIYDNITLGKYSFYDDDYNIHFDKWYNIKYICYDHNIFNKIFHDTLINNYYDFYSYNAYIYDSLYIINKNNKYHGDIINLKKNFYYLYDNSHSVPYTNLMLNIYFDVNDMYNKKYLNNYNNIVVFNLIMHINTEISNYIFKYKQYDYMMAKYNINIFFSNNCLHINICGFVNRIANILFEYLNIFMSIKNKNKKKFYYIKSIISKKLSNELYKQPYNMVIDNIKKINNVLNFNFIDYLDVIDKLNYNLFKHYISNINNNKYDVKCLCIGNINNYFFNLFYNIVNMYFNDNKYRHIVINKNIENNIIYKQIINHNIAIGIFFNIGIFDFHFNVDIYKYILLKYINLFIGSSFFDIIRTKKQFGYICINDIFIAKNHNKCTYSYGFIVQSHTQKKDILINSIDEYITKFLNKKIKEDKNIDKYKTSIIDNIKKKFANIFEKSNYYNDQLLNEYYDFDINEKILLLINEIKLNDIINFFHNYFIKNEKYKYIIKIL
jgi:insulysin